MPGTIVRSAGAGAILGSSKGTAARSSVATPRLNTIGFVPSSGRVVLQALNKGGPTLEALETIKQTKRAGTVAVKALGRTSTGDGATTALRTAKRVPQAQFASLFLLTPPGINAETGLQAMAPGSPFRPFKFLGFQVGLGVAAFAIVAAFMLFGRK